MWGETIEERVAIVPLGGDKTVNKDGGSVGSEEGVESGYVVKAEVRLRDVEMRMKDNVLPRMTPRLLN